MLHKKLLKNFATDAHRFIQRQVSLNLKKLRDNKEPVVLDRLKAISFSDACEEATYSWFNRLIILRFFELHDYLPAHIKSLHFWHNKDDFKSACSFLAETIPQLFPEELVYLELLVDLAFESTHPIIQRLLDIPDEDFAHTEIIGWLYQYYNAQQREKIISAKKPYAKSVLPCASQLFTPDWASKYLVENSLGQFMLDTTHRVNLVKNWQFYVQQAPESPETVQEVQTLDPEKITFLDPCCGSGHILVYAFEIFYQVYLAQGIPLSEIPSLILENNLFGLEIDQRATQLAIASVLLKAREYDTKIFQKPVARNLQIFSIPDSNQLGKIVYEWIDEAPIRNKARQLFNFFVDGANLGSLLIPSSETYIELDTFLAQSQAEDKTKYKNILQKLLKVYRLLQKHYDVVATNPPYIKRQLLNKNIQMYIDDNYPEYNVDLFTAFIKRSAIFVDEESRKKFYLGFMTPSNWLFTNKFTQFRQNLLHNYCITSLIQPYNHAFFNDASVQICMFVLSNSYNSLGKYLQCAKSGDMDVQKDLFLNHEFKVFHHDNSDFFTLPNCAILFWLDQKVIATFKKFPSLSSLAEIKQGIITGDNQRFVRYWFEVDQDELGKKWLPYNKGGKGFRWYGNREFVINWQNNGDELKNNFLDHGKLRSRIQNLSYNFRPALSWSLISEQNFAVRAYDESFIFGSAGPSCFTTEKNYYYLLGLLNSCVAKYILNTLNPSMNYNIGDLSKFPTCIDEKIRKTIEQCAQENLTFAQQDYDSFENSRAFRLHPLLRKTETKTLAEAYFSWEEESDRRFAQTQANEKTINEKFIVAYQLDDLLDAESHTQKPTLRHADLTREIKSLLSYFLGVLFRRYNTPTLSHYENILYISDLEHGNLAELFKDFMIQAYSAETFSENLEIIVDMLGHKSRETNFETILRYFQQNFFLEHTKTYHGHPIYWLLDSGPTHAFRAFVYGPNLTPSLLRQISVEQLPTLRAHYISERERYTKHLEQKTLPANCDFMRQQVDLYEQKISEIELYTERLKTLTDRPPRYNIDQSIIANYAKFQTILANIPPTCHRAMPRDII